MDLLFIYIENISILSMTKTCVCISKDKILSFNCLMQCVTNKLTHYYIGEFVKNRTLTKKEFESKQME